ncbi:hypothetical protein AMTR_s00040p00233470, partial [Amborella trichopoda]
KGGEQRDWRLVNAEYSRLGESTCPHDKGHRHIEQGLNNGVPSKEYKAWYRHSKVHNTGNPPRDILQPTNKSDDQIDASHEPQCIMRPRGHEDNMVSTFQESTTLLAEALALRQRWDLEVLNPVSRVFELQSKFIPIDVNEVEERM